MKRALLADARIPLKVLILAYLPGMALIVVVSILSYFSETTLTDWFKDPATLTGTGPLLGFVSNAGAVIWSAAVAICFFSANLLRRAEPEEARFFLAAAVLTGYLMLDDLFLIHESVKLIGLTELHAIVPIAVGMLAFLWCFRRRILARHWGSLGLALALFALSVVIDAEEDQLGWHFGIISVLLEDGGKFIGIVAWCAYFTERAAARLGRPV